MCQLTKDKIQRKKQTTSDDDIWLQTSGVLVPDSATHSLCDLRDILRKTFLAFTFPFYEIGIFSR